jgi:hypothetical protein
MAISFKYRLSKLLDQCQLATERRCEIVSSQGEGLDLLVNYLGLANIDNQGCGYTAGVGLIARQARV